MKSIGIDFPFVLSVSEYLELPLQSQILVLHLRFELFNSALNFYFKCIFRLCFCTHCAHIRHAIICIFAFLVAKCRNLHISILVLRLLAFGICLRRLRHLNKWCWSDGLPTLAKFLSPQQISALFIASHGLHLSKWWSCLTIHRVSTHGWWDCLTFWCYLLWCLRVNRNLLLALIITWWIYHLYTFLA